MGENGICMRIFLFIDFYFSSRKNHPFYADVPAYLIIIVIIIHSLVGYESEIFRWFLFLKRTFFWFMKSLTVKRIDPKLASLSSSYFYFCHSNNFRSAPQSIISVQTAFCISFHSVFIYYDERTFHVVEKLFYPTFLLIYYSSLCYWLLNYSSNG